MTVPKDRPYTWITWVAKLLVGENVCMWSAWFRSHFDDYEKADSDFDTMGWNVVHTGCAMDLADRLEAEGCEVFIENQNYFRQTSAESGSVVSDKPDVIALHPDGRATVYDVKTGRERGSHQSQVKLYTYLLPRVKGTRSYGLTFDGGCSVGTG